MNTSKKAFDKNTPIGVFDKNTPIGRLDVDEANAEPQSASSAEEFINSETDVADQPSPEI